ncbi:plasmid partitioning protein RepB C-terminal domain-containing protein [Reyranella soli]|uniref:Chromosome partitioning protein ParB n=1 Tax=Reyranella soli TaxID=1230389 RepID=A0A512NKH6_9HYPH|nr:plasmid partitioning protein RepB C-terminal domain-containing protein [Reyranella soli]GEP59454.1 chromosome partitioning protein ParB [Reyranella soli]
MKRRQSASKVQLVPIDKIAVINPRKRNRKVFEGIVQSIAQLGLKRPITVIRKASPNGEAFDLVCGQGRMEAFKVLGQTEIPALVIEATTQEALVMSLVENVARRQHRAIDLLRDVEGMKRRGYSIDQIAHKTDLSPDYVRGVIRLTENGEHRLLRAVEAGTMPISVAMQIAESPDEEVQAALQQAYEKGDLKGRKIVLARQLVEQRRRRGKGFGATSKKGGPRLSATALIRTYQQDVERKRQMVRKAETTRDRLTFAVQALRSLLADDGFASLLRKEGLDTLPRNLATRLQGTSYA